MIGTLFKLSLAVFLVLATLGLSLPLAHEAGAVVAPDGDVIAPGEGIPTLEPLPLALPDLTVTAFEFVRSGRTTAAGDSIWQLNYTVTNNGDVATGPFFIGIATRATGMLVSLVPVPGGIGTGMTNSMTFTFTLPEDRPCEFDGDIQVDRFNAVAESNETNNRTRVTHIC